MNNSDGFKAMQFALSDNESLSQGNEDFVNMNDVEAFEKALFHDPLSDQIISQVDSISSSLSDKKLEFEKLLKTAADTTKPEDILAATRSLSEYSLHTSMVAKAAGKSSQAIEKLTNLH